MKISFCVGLHCPDSTYVSTFHWIKKDIILPSFYAYIILLKYGINFHSYYVKYKKEKVVQEIV